MSKDKVVTVEANVVDARYDFSSNEILVKLDLKGKKVAVRLNSEAIFGSISVDIETMKQYAEAMARRKLPIKLEVLESQLEEDNNG
jgi:hypothetical protein